ncbi:MAG: ABC transporter ATP-binding protein [Parvibaculaceae bacterium]
MASIRFENVVKHYGAYQAIRNVSFAIPDGEFVVIVGPSGSGKTTMLRAIGGLERVNSGRIHIGDRDVTDLAPKHRDIAFVFQNYALYAHLTVRNNIGFPLKARGMPKAEIAGRVEDVAERAGLKALLDRKPSALSGGQQQRVAIARALVRKPKVFLFDEPLSNLDAQLRLDMRREVLELQQSLGVTSVWVTHDQEEAMAMGDRILVVNHGIVEQNAAPEALYSDPINAYVARTIGSPTINMLRGQLNGQGLDVEGVRFPLPGGALQGDIMIGIRPEDIHPVKAGSDQHNATPPFEAKVQLIELLGARAIMTLLVGSHRLTAVFNRRDLADIREFDTIRVSAASDRLLYFKPETGERIRM